MTAKPLPFFKRKLNDIAKELYLENGWKMSGKSKSWNAASSFLRKKPLAAAQ